MNVSIYSTAVSNTTSFQFEYLNNFVTSVNKLLPVRVQPPIIGMIASNKHNVMMEFTGRLIYQGAESRVYESLYIDRPVIIKERLSKSYRVKELDKKINKHRLQQEIKCMVKCRRAGVATPRYNTRLILCICIHHVIIQTMSRCMEAST